MFMNKIGVHQMSKTDTPGYEGFMANLNPAEILYDIVLLLDPVQKTVLCAKGEPMKDCTYCFEYLCKDTYCYNCIGMGAFHREQPLYKLDYGEDSYFFVSAQPVIFQGRKLIIETVKDISQSVVGEEGMRSRTHEMKEPINKLNFEVMRDNLTGLFDEIYLEKRIAAFFTDVAKEVKDTCIIYLMLERLGLESGNSSKALASFILLQAAKTIKNTLRPFDCIIRKGNSEFVILMPGVKREEAENYLKRLCQAIRRTLIVSADEEFFIKANAGVAYCDLPYNIGFYEYLAAAQEDAKKRNHS